MGTPVKVFNGEYDIASFLLGEHDIGDLAQSEVIKTAAKLLQEACPNVSFGRGAELVAEIHYLDSNLLYLVRARLKGQEHTTGKTMIVRIDDEQVSVKLRERKEAEEYLDSEFAAATLSDSFTQMSKKVIGAASRYILGMSDERWKFSVKANPSTNSVRVCVRENGVHSCIVMFEP